MDSNAGTATLGSQLSAIRARKRWTLKEMSMCTGIPVSTLSKVENNRLSLTYEKLVRLSQRLEIPIAELFSSRSTRDKWVVTARRSIGNLDSARCVRTKNEDYYHLCPELRWKRMIPVLMKIRAGSGQDSPDLICHSGEEYAYVLQGCIEVITVFYDPVTLKAGESIYIDANMGHAYAVSSGFTEALVLALSFVNDGVVDSSLACRRR